MNGKNTDKTYTCDRCGQDAPARGKLPTDMDEYRFCAQCWSELHEWVKQGDKHLSKQS